MEKQVIIHLRLVRKSGEPLKGLSTHVKLYDKDILKDDYLGGMILDDEGRGRIKITRSKFVSLDSPTEKYPDIYFEVLKGDDVFFKSKVFQDLKVEDGEMVQDGIHFDLGTFVV